MNDMSVGSMIAILQHAGFVIKENESKKNQITAGTGYLDTKNGKSMKNCFVVFVGEKNFQAVINMTGELINGSTPKALVDKIKEKYKAAGLI